MVRKVKEIKPGDQSLVGKIALFKTVYSHGVVDAPRLIVSASKSMLGVKPTRNDPLDSVSNKSYRSLLFVCDTVAEAERLHNISVQCSDDIFHLDKQCRNTTEQVSILLGAKP